MAEPVKPRRGRAKEAPATEPTVETVPLERPINFAVAQADTVAAARSPLGLVELSALSLQNRFVAQRFTITTDTSDARTLESGDLIGRMALVETGLFRMTETCALSVIEILARHLVERHGVTKETVLEAIRASGVLD